MEKKKLLIQSIWKYYYFNFNIYLKFKKYEIKHHLKIMLEEKMNEKIAELTNENQQLKQQLNSQGEMIRQLQQQMADITATSLVSPRNDNKIFPIPFLSYQEIEPNHDTEQYFKNLIKYVCENYKKVKYGTWIGAVSPNGRGWMILTIYNTDDLNQEKLPRHCGGCYQTCSTKLYTFSTYNFAFSSKSW